MPKNKNKPHQGLLKRVRITKSGMLKIGRAGQRHLKSKKASDRIRNYRHPKNVKASESRRLGMMLNRKIRSAEQAARDKAAKTETKEST